MIFIATQRKFHYAWVILFAMCIIRSLSAAGINNTAGLFLSPISADLGVGIGTLSIHFSISSLATLFFMPIAAKIIQRYSIKTLILVGTILQTGSYVLLTFMHFVWAWYILSIPMGIGGAILVNLAGPILINRWFANNTGTALGILAACVGIFGAFLQPLVLTVITNLGWRAAHFLLGATIGIIILLVASTLIKSKPEDVHTTALQRKETRETGKAETHIKNIPLKIAIKSRAFYCLLIFMIAITAFAAFSQHMATYGETLGYNSAEMGTILSISMIGSTIGAILIGILCDKIGVYKTTLAIIVSVLLSIVCIALGKVSFLVFAVGSFLLGLSAMGIPILSPILTSTFFGKQEYESIYSNVMMGPPFATVVLLPLYGFVYDFSGTYRLVLAIMLCFAILGGFSFYFGWRAQEKLQINETKGR